MSGTRCSVSGCEERVVTSSGRRCHLHKGKCNYPGCGQKARKYRSHCEEHIKMSPSKIHYFGQKAVP